MTFREQAFQQKPSFPRKREVGLFVFIDDIQGGFVIVSLAALML